MDNRPLRQEDYLAMSEQNKLLIAKNEKLERSNTLLRTERFKSFWQGLPMFFLSLTLGIGAGATVGITTERIYFIRNAGDVCVVKFQPNPYIDWELDRLNE